jgi:hypothetical protein
MPAAPRADAPRAAPATSRIDIPSSRRSRLICSNNSTLDRAIPDFHADNTDAQIASREGPTFETTR